MFDGCLTMSIHMLNYASGHVNAHKSLQRSRLNPVQATPPTLVLWQIDGSGKLPESKKGSGSKGSDSSSLLLTQANTVGIIGGISVKSTMKFLKKLVMWSSKDGQDPLPFVLCSDPVLTKELLSHERNFFPSHGKPNGSYLLDDATILENLQRKKKFLEKSGARCMVMPCHISHSWHDEISKGCYVPFLHMGECIAKELKEANMRPLEAGSPLRIGVLGTNSTLTTGFYQEKLESEGFEVVLPDKATMEHAVIPALQALDRKDKEGARNLLRIALQVLFVRAVNTVILASDDMRDILPRNDPLLIKCVDPIDALARSTIKWAQAAGKDTQEMADRIL